MHSSTSNSEPDPATSWPETYWRRPIPSAHWQGVSLLTAVLVLGFLVAWETWWRHEGYEPGYEETPELWAQVRDKSATGSPFEVVLTGSSRIQHDLDLDAWEQDFGGPRPLMLAKVGTNPRPFVTDLANDPDFRGIFVVGVTEGLFFAPDQAPPAFDAIKYLDHYKKRPFTARTDFILSVPIQSALASMNAEDLRLGTLLRKEWLRLPNRANAQLMPEFPPYFGRISPDRRYHMWSLCERPGELQDRIRQIWLPLFQMGPPFGGEGLTQLIASVRADVEKIRARGGQVVFVRFPSTGQLRDIERERWPREAYWDRLIAETGAPGIHFEDYPGLKDFPCPEWSHLSRVDAVTFTRNLIPVLREKLEPR
jgi:hypothetical protein